MIGALLAGIQAAGAAEPAPQHVDAPTAPGLTDKINAFLQAPAYKQAHWGVLVVDLGSSETLYEHEADKLYAPASVTKLYSVAAALDALGANYKFETPIYARGEVDASGRLEGDLILVASGDLSLGGRTDEAGHIAYTNADHIYGGDGVELTKGDPLAGLNELARQVAASGIHAVQGDVLVDDRLFDHAEGTGSGPSRLTPIMVNDNLIDLIVSPVAKDQPATVECRPKTDAIQVDVQVRTVASDGRTKVHVERAGHDRLVVRGDIAAGRKPLVRSEEIEDPASFARSLLIEALARAGVRVQASALENNRADRLPLRENYAQQRRVALLTSPSFAESVRLVLKVSHNLQASTLPLLVAAKHGQRT
ncbi:MAG: D-alanyl-D-alanine carboxypeptidase/D-alanyl-D-alanine-endopeptidase, partial [Candidatus Saccharimonadales bacterium]